MTYTLKVSNTFVDLLAKLRAEKAELDEALETLPAFPGVQKHQQEMENLFNLLHAEISPVEKCLLTIDDQPVA